MTKLERSIDIIKTAIATNGRSVVLWSGGKDSMVLLHIIRNVLGVKCPVALFRDPWQPHKYKFQDNLIKEWGLEVYSWHPSANEFAQNEDLFEVMNYYKFNETVIACHSRIAPPEAGKGWVCSIDMLKRPKQATLLSNWDTVWSGHKGCDTDPIHGITGTKVETMLNPGNSTFMFPLRDWSHEDIWAYIESENIPWDSDRYEKVDGKYQEKVDLSNSSDYVHACTACVDCRAEASKVVHCPKFNTSIENCADKLPWFQSLPTYMKH
ncbi:Phosphoadenosine phosphosulphate reductase [uncultured Caudovirales phage]|uniref:Phosphoadenosine phosphosulphate reductase n=1 Tax=uncultured Caudovirales phage TaxID=2100421 RepID=A0A6J7XPH8_9CAUD|nr:Phosphoadenosine phosphosulphate reductase [uncultured Caudovirales phage]